VPRLEPFPDELPVPDTVRPVVEPTEPHLVVAARATVVRRHSALPDATVWSYRREVGAVARRGTGRSYLGPTIEVERGQEVTVTWKNGIAAGATLPFEVVKVPNADAAATRPVPQNEPGRDGALPDEHDVGRRHLRRLEAALVTHLHGGRTQSYSDGWSDDTIVSGQFTRYTYENDQAAAMLWYHDHAMHVTRLNVHAGLTGVWLVRDREERRLALPNGAYELPLVLRERNLDVDDAGRFTGALLPKTEVDDGPMEFFGPYTLRIGRLAAAIQCSARCDAPRRDPFPAAARREAGVDAGLHSRREARPG
jgi:spore coat protein A